MIRRFLVVAPIALAVSAAFLGTATSPAAAATPVDCVAAPAQLRAAAATADPAKARLALANVKTGEAMCAADNRFEAKSKFAAAAKLLGVDTAQLAAAPAPATN